MNVNTSTFHYSDIRWDIPILQTETQIDQKLFEQAVASSERTGFIIPLQSGFILVWKDQNESAWCGSAAFRAWTAGVTPLQSEDLSRLSAELHDRKADFASLSSWLPLPKHAHFIGTGISVYAAIEQVDESLLLNDDSISIQMYKTGELPAAWSRSIIDHVSNASYHDRHAKDPFFSLAQVTRRRTDWLKTQLSSSDAFIATVSDDTNALLAYIFVPIDRSRQVYGGPIVAGVNGLSGSLSEGRWLVRKAFLHGFHQTRSMYDIAILQYQPENLPIRRFVERTIHARTCSRYDAHWHRSLITQQPDRE